MDEWHSEVLEKHLSSEDELENLVNKIIVDRIERALGKKNPCKKIAFFVGAGISVPFPSKMPDFNKLNLHVIKTIADSKLSDEDYKLLSNNIRPEVMYQIATDTLGYEVLYSIEELEGHDPNYYHVFLSEAIKQGNWVFTTNVDNLIEDACRMRDVAFTSCYGRNKDEDFNKILSYINSEREVPSGCIFKLHGSIEEGKEGIDKYNTIMFALRQVGKGLFEPRRDVLKYFLNKFDFIFIGYRCRDDFSVFPVLEETKSSKDIFWFRYDDGPLAMSILEENRINWEIKREEYKPLNLDRDLDLLNLDKMLLARGGMKLRFDGNLGELIENKLRLWCPDIPRDGLDDKKKKSENFSKWATGKNEFDKYVFIGRLFEQVGQRDKAEKFYEEALKVAKDDFQRVIMKINLAELYYKESVPGKEEYAITLYTQCISSCKNPLERASLKTNISNIQRRRGIDYYSDSLQKAEEAKREFESILNTEFENEALALSLNENDKKSYLEYAKFLNVYGLILYSLEKLPEARSSCLKSAKIKSYFGDVEGIGESENAVSIIFTREGRNLINQNKVDDSRVKFKEAIKHASTAMDSRRKIGNIRGYAQNCRNIAWPNSELMKLTTDEDERLKYFEAAKDGYTAGISYWNRLKNPPSGEVVLFSNLLAKLYIDFCSTIHDNKRKEKWIRVLAQDIIPRYRNIILVDTISRKIAQSDKRVPTAESNLKGIKNLFEKAELSAEAAEVEKILNELSRSSE